MRYSRRTSNYLERIAWSDMSRLINMADLVAIYVETPRIDRGCSLDKEFTKLICMNPLMTLYLLGSQVDKPSKISIKTLIIVEYIESDIQILRNQ